MSITLTGELVHLRTPREADNAEFLSMRSDPEHLRTGTPGLPVPPGESFVREGDWTTRAQNPMDAGLVGFVIERLEDGAYLGTTGYTVESAVHRVAIAGIGLRREETGKGYGTDAIRVLSDFAFDQHGIEVVRLTVLDNNPAGIRAYEKAGFEIVGRLREAVWRDGAWLDEVEMARVRPD